ncbi:MAG: DNA-binding domain-containing protein [Pseudomonadota bacterium]
MTSQTDFTTALLDAAQTVPLGLVNPDGSPAAKRFDVYRNNVAASLTEALEVGFPVIHKLLGDDNFKGIAGMFLRAHPPSSPVLMFYGAEFPAFLEGLEPLKHLPYLSDVARLELALRQSYHAADATPFDPSILETLPEDALMQSQFRFAPAVRLIRSRYPIHGIWEMNMVPGTPKPGPTGENILISRPEFDPIMTKLIPGGGMFVDRLAAGLSFGEALQATLEKLPDFNLSAVLVQLIEAAAITDIVRGTS